MLWRKKEMANNRKERENQTGNAQDISLIVQKLNEMRFATEQYNIALNQYNLAVEQYNLTIEQYKAKNPDIDVEALLSEENDLLPILDLLPNCELDKFIRYAKKQGTKMSFDAMEMGVVAAGRTDMQDGLAQIANALEFDTPICPKCNKEMRNCGRSKKKF
jgi:hypothetical protein